MTPWQPDLARFPGPRYVAIADALAADITAGRFHTGDRLPTHRDLAWRLGVTIGTVSRAYAEAARRGLISGEIGRGTYVRAVAPAVTHAMAGSQPATDAFIDMTLNFPPAMSNTAALSQTLHAMADDPASIDLLRYHPNSGMAAHRAAGAEWLSRSGVSLPPEQVLVTAGAQHGVTVVMAALTRPGDHILTEETTYPGLQLIARLLGLQLSPLPLDEHGIVPDALDAACRRGGYRAVYCIPTLHNPTTSTMPAERRQAIVDIARRHNLPIVEDDIFRRLAAAPPPTLFSLAPDLVYHVTGLSKTTAPGLRVGYVAAPPTAVERLASAIRTTCWIASPVSVEIASRWIGDGTAERILDESLQESAWRRARAMQALGRWDIRCEPGALHVWLRLPEPWRATDFATEAKRHGLGVTPAEAFTVGRRVPVHAIRACLGQLPSREVLEKALGLLTDLLEDRPSQAFGAIV
jgi:DNA-binding transcriptional MocR family regulator